MLQRDAPLDVLIVEDEAILMMDLEMIVEDAGNRVVADAASFDEVVDLPDALQPHLALVDVQLANGSSGIEVAKLIRNRWPDAAIVFVTANPKQLPENYCGAHGVIPKPFSRLGMAAAINYIVEGVRNPPPLSPRPGSFIAAPHVAVKWAIA
jgi:DNA-binding LytR/AlgR family response regulator